MMNMSNEILVAVNSSNVGIVIADNTQEDIPIIFINPAFTILTGYEESEVIGKNCRFLQRGEAEEAIVDQIRVAIRSGKQFEGTLLNYRKDGSKFWNKLTINPVFDSSGAVTRFVGIQEDVTRHIIREEEREKVLSQLEDFAGILAHDLKAPIRHVLGFIKLYIEEGREIEGNELIKPFLDRALSSALKASDIIENTLDFARDVHHGLEKEPVDLNAVVAEVLKVFELDIEEINASFQVDELPIVLGCKTQIYQVFQNLISNALKYRDPSRQCKIHIYFPNTDEASVVIKDNGIGIPETELANVFSAYKRASNAKHKDGSGIGLATVQRIMQSYGANISVSSKCDEGTSFTMVFPTSSIRELRTGSQKY